MLNSDALKKLQNNIRIKYNFFFNKIYNDEISECYGKNKENELLKGKGLSSQLKLMFDDV